MVGHVVVLEGGYRVRERAMREPEYTDVAAFLLDDSEPRSPVARLLVAG
jgi:hypothetical protein